MLDESRIKDFYFILILIPFFIISILISFIILNFIVFVLFYLFFLLVQKNPIKPPNPIKPTGLGFKKTRVFLNPGAQSH